MSRAKDRKQAKAAMADRGRDPRSAFAMPVDPRQARAVPLDPHARNPVWAFRIVDLDGPWCWSKMSAADTREVLRRLGNYETMTWREIDGPKSHGIPFGDLAKAARDRLVEIDQDDAAEYFSLRVNSAGRVWGIRDAHILRLLWWDPGHEVCPSRTYRQ